MNKGQIFVKIKNKTAIVKVPKIRKMKKFFSVKKVTVGKRPFFFLSKSKLCDREIKTIDKNL